MSTPVAPSYDLKNGQLRNVLLATFISTIGFWAWTIVGPLAKMYAKQMHLDAGMTSLLVAMPIFIGAMSARTVAENHTDVCSASSASPDTWAFHAINADFAIAGICCLSVSFIKTP